MVGGVKMIICNTATTITHKGFDIAVDITYKFWPGRTPAMGPHPDHIELTRVEDGTGANILIKLDKKQYDHCFTTAWEDAPNHL